MEIQFIYALICPEENIIKYIGKTRDLSIRLQGHINYALRKNHLKGKHEWIRNLHSKKLKPIMIILEQCNENTWQEREEYWIEYYSKQFSLFNKTSGGEDFVFKSGHNPWNKGGGKFSVESRQKMSNSHKGKILESEHKDKISQSLLGKSKSTEHRLNIRKGQGKIVQQWDIEGNLIAEYLASTFAAEAVGCKRESIRDACKGKIKLCKGFKWTFKNQ